MYYGTKWDCLNNPAGTVQHFANILAPIGYLECNGQSVSTTTYPELFSAIGYTYGGSGASFNVPDLRGEFIRGWDNTKGSDAGRVLGTAQTDALQNIQGSIGNIQLVYGPTCNVDPLFSGSTQSGVGGTYSHCNGVCGQGAFDVNFDASKVARTSSETRPRNIALLTCIKY
jgi:phage-related tail fiber protein